MERVEMIFPSNTCHVSNTIYVKLRYRDEKRLRLHHIYKITPYLVLRLDVESYITLYIVYT